MGIYCQCSGSDSGEADESKLRVTTPLGRGVEESFSMAVHPASSMMFGRQATSHHRSNEALG